MTAQSNSDQAILDIRAADDGTEIFVMDGGLVRIAKGVGYLQVPVSPGLYKVRFRSGATHHDQLVDASKPGSKVGVQGPAIEFRAAAPLDNTRTTHASQAAPAQEESHKTHRNAGSDGQLFLFVREVQEEHPFSSPDVTVHRLDGSLVCSMSDGAKDLEQRWAAVSISIDRGTYLIRVGSRQLGDYEIFVTVSLGWQTQVFLTMEDFWREGQAVRSPSLRTASVQIVRKGDGFDASNNSHRICELARQSLTQGRDVISKGVMQELLNEKFGAPMLGILAANLLLKRHRPNWALLNKVCRNLESLLGPHPDVEALTLVIRDWKGERVGSFENPPLLRLSWGHVVRASRRRAGLVSSGSPLARIAEELVVAGPWLMHRIQEHASERYNSRSTLAGAERALESLVALDNERLLSLVKESREGGKRFSSLERSVLGAALSHSRTRGFGGEGAAAIDHGGAAKRFFREFPAPTYAIADAVLSLESKMNLEP